jgi:ubiquinone/menaquinone biosynthesis C-methylase UbiE
MSVLDFGCGPGGFSLAAARLVGPRGRVIAVDIHPLAIRRLERAVRRRGLGHLQVIHGDAMPQVPSGSVDVTLLFDVLHEIEDPATTLAEIRRVLKQDGVLSVTDHCMKGDALVQSVTGNGWFRLISEGETPLRFELTKLSVVKT